MGIFTRATGRLRRAPGVALLGMAALLTKPVVAQVGTTVCSCTPAVYDITLDLAKTCDDTGGFTQGVLLTDCSVIPFDDPSITNLVPVSVTLIDISELGQNLQTVVGQRRFSGNFGSGDMVSYTSISNDPESINDMNLPKALQLSMIGVNSDGEDLVFSALLAYSNSCDIYPLFLPGASNGWAGLVSAKCITGPIGNRLVSLIPT